jgi:uncharacterized protein (UPF0332 family)
VNFKDLEDKGLISAYNAPKEQIRKEILLAERDIKVAKKNLEDDNDWAFAIAYNAILQAGRALMFSRGFRPRGEAQHKTVLEFAGKVIGKAYDEKIGFINKMRINRHRVLYDEPELISDSEADHAVRIAAEFVEIIKKKI